MHTIRSLGWGVILAVSLTAPCGYAESRPSLAMNAALMTQPQNLYEPFLIEAKIKNVSDTLQIITVWQCDEGSNWVTDQENLKLNPDSCQGERLTRVLLQPGKSYARRLKLNQHESISAHATLSFKIGFRTIKEPNYLGTIRYEEAPVWSQPITVDYSLNR